MENSNTKNKDKIIFKSHSNFFENDKTIETTKLNQSTNIKNDSDNVEIVTINYKPYTEEQKKTISHMDSEEFEESKNHLSSKTVINPDGTIETRMTYNIFLNKNNDLQ